MDIAEIPSEYEVIISLPQGEKPSVPSVQSVWAGADWNEKDLGLGWNSVFLDMRICSSIEST